MLHPFIDILRERADANRIGVLVMVHEGFDVDKRENRFMVRYGGATAFTAIMENATRDHMRIAATAVIQYFLSLPNDAKETNG